MIAMLSCSIVLVKQKGDNNAIEIREVHDDDLIDFETEGVPDEQPDSRQGGADPGSGDEPSTEPPPETGDAAEGEPGTGTGSAAAGQRDAAAGDDL